MGNSIFKSRSTYLLLLPLFFSICFSLNKVQGQTTSTHFVTVWMGQNGQNHMNIKVVSGILDQVQLSAGDEIAVFSGVNCVGATKLTQAINPLDYSTFPNISASQDDGSSNGFIENDVIIFKIWDSKNQKELEVTSVSYKNSNTSWLCTGKFSSGATSVVEIMCSTALTQTINLIKGNNLFSTYLVPTNPDITVVLKSMMDLGYLISVQDESGNTYAKNKNGIWINKIGSIGITEGYLINLSANNSLQISGKKIDLPLDIPLSRGWNFISIPVTVPVDAMKTVQTLIDQNKLVKVQDERGNSIETVRKSGVWMNNIGTFYPGKSYKINVNSNTSLRFQ